MKKIEKVALPSLLLLIASLYLISSGSDKGRPKANGDAEWVAGMRYLFDDVPQDLSKASEWRAKALGII